MAGGKRGRPPGPNYEKNRKRLMRSLSPVPTARGMESVETPLTTSRKTEYLEAFTESPVYGKTIQFLKSVAGQLKSGKEDKKILLEETQRFEQQGVKYRDPYRPAFEQLRFASYNTTLTGAIHQLFVDDMKHHTHRDPVKGFDFRPENSAEKLNASDQGRTDELASMVRLMGDRTLPDWRNRDRFPAVIEMATRDILAIDLVAYYIRKNRRGAIISIEYLDPATIYRINPRKGFSGRLDGTSYSNDTSITHVQVLQGKVTEVFGSGEILYRSKSNISDVRYRGQGFSPVEGCIHEIMGQMRVMQRQNHQLDDRNPPRVMFSSKSNVSEEVLEYLQAIWEAAYSNNRSSFRIPLLYGIEDLQIHKLDVQDDLLWVKFLHWSASMICMRHGKNPAELGLRLNEAASLSEANLDGQADFSRARSHISMAEFHQAVFNDILDEFESKRPLMFFFTGLVKEDEDKSLERNVKKLNNFISIDAMREEYNQPAIGDILKKYKVFKDNPEMLEKAQALGGMIPNQHFAQAYMGLLNESSGETDGDEGMPDGEFDEEDAGNEGVADDPFEGSDFDETIDILNQELNTPDQE